ncbi:MAG: hypothetical protein A2513_03430 [Sulfurimonas sp. RIFOXYD12_FULL_33_39]|uniref:response regulator n=1 Tax=unclassified Sulfurimonas TaxID=2623549 RepID=UPI0008BEE527|nr:MULTISPECIES: response regulator [unclassified Sulfurimonas]OHE09194.1 MAG: hypothetical protein A2513_03430 [Sulfurimonas sp. RIFOXYD12_FULL_33_39]OHE13023.1 MAG: hypothetical protein A2530_05375 [Sulfurimonas sp. RIFOXYD2_FULL_34_21]
MDSNTKPNINSLTKRLKEVCYEINLLLVEDDIFLQDQIKQFLSKFFNKIDTANNGIEALEKYIENSYELVITDLTMPMMNGIELTKNIKEIKNTQNILILSAHYESENLLPLVNIGIDGFITKPMDMEKTLLQLIKTCELIYNDKLLRYYHNILEETNEELLKNNHKSEYNLVATKNHKLQPTSKIPEVKESVKSKDVCILPKSTKMSAVDFFNAYPFELEKTNEDLEMLEDKFNLALIRSEKNIHGEMLEQFIEIMKCYAHTIEMIPQFGALSYGIRQLAKTFEFIEDPQKLSSALPMLAHLFDNLEQWRKAVFYYCDAEDIHYMDDSLISDAQSLQGILDYKSNSSDSDSDDIELF